MPDCHQHVLNAGAEGGDGGVGGGAAFLALTQRIALLLGHALLRNVSMRRYPAAGGQWAKYQCDCTTVLELNRFRFRAPLGHLFQAVGDVLIGIAGERASPRAANKNLTQRHAALEMLTRQLRHFDVTLIAKDEPGGAIKHTQPLGHVVKRNICQPVASTFLGENDESADRQSGERERHGEDNGRR